ncbi:7-carboxy-7-deazaguanine synthase QueE [Hippea maritima]|uniref:7-carboxy-7-deazaguanine synthase n=1 Tax=Hippea maritima (strain ATCC 700847 / DSM 10411 / MH2) TaxID=760142 RepID=F2LX28_HIPMA|nr:7-carboxy-7-deazaguanine synthase QueE [Hippea maritima]AEA33086.1 Radical SAM domain protein [Hippea maritima DSM 10411]
MIVDVSEIFYSIQGEGSKIGYKAIFIRLCGCNLKCPFCDTKYALSCKNPMNAHEIYEKISRFPAKNIIFTGGEPTLKDNFMAYFMKKYNNYSYFLETNGTLFPKKSINLFSHIVVSPKMFAINLDVLKSLIKYSISIEFKFVVDENFTKELELMEELGLKEATFQPVWLNDSMESYIKKTVRIIEKLKDIPYNIRIIPQIHKILYGQKKGV